MAVSPQIPDESLSLTHEHELACDVLSDLGSDTARQYGLAFDYTQRAEPADILAALDAIS